MISKYFTLEELTRSVTAQRMCINNTPSAAGTNKLSYLSKHCLDKIRELWGKPIHVNSGYRCTELNKAIGGAKNSQHILCEAADITTGSVDGNKGLFDLIVKSDIDFDQLIDERNYQWLHVSCKYLCQGNRHQILHL